MIRNQIVIAAALTLLLGSPTTKPETAVFAGGCFWCVEALYQEVEGVSNVVSGFTGGELINPTYNGDHSGHYEAVEVTFDPNRVDFETLLDLFWVNIDPFDNRGQFCDKGPSYRSAIFVNGGQKQKALDSKTRVMARFADKTIYTEILDRSIFYPVEDYHQDYYKKNPLRYNLYRTGCRRDARLHQIWGDEAKH